MKERYRAMSSAAQEVAPYACGKDCLNNEYKKKEKK
jgi:hypothetical protein